LHQAAADSIDLSFDLELCASNVLLITRGPYLQLGTPTQMIVRWRTDTASDSRVDYGTSVSNLTLTAGHAAPTKDHEILLHGLTPNTRYYYAVGTLNERQAANPDCYFITAPTNAPPTRIWIIGDTRAGDANQAAVRDAYYQDTGSRYTDVWLLLGDHGGPTGADSEFQYYFFNCYSNLMRQTVSWPCIGNHETYVAGAPAHFPYLDIYSLPAVGEAGGAPSDSERYYSFNYGNIHFVVLDSSTSDVTTDGPMYAWLANDLDQATNEWLIAYWHAPPYTKGSHDSDYEGECFEMRRNFLPLLEEYGVDLVFGGHSHSYERSKLIDGHYGSSWQLTAEMVKNNGDGRRAGDGPYLKPSGRVPRQGTVYVVVGSSGFTSGGTFDHPIMACSLNVLGSMVLEVSGNILEAKFLRETGAIDDSFTILKGSPPLKIKAAEIKSGKLTLSWDAEVGRAYRVFKRADWKSPWVPATNGPGSLGNLMIWSETVDPAQPAAFYWLESYPD
jgi:hypothetical protein